LEVHNHPEVLELLGALQQLLAKEARDTRMPVLMELVALLVVVEVVTTEVAQELMPPAVAHLGTTRAMFLQPHITQEPQTLAMELLQFLTLRRHRFQLSMQAMQLQTTTDL
jgi:hypothetical protein